VGGGSYATSAPPKEAPPPPPTLQAAFKPPPQPQQQQAFSQPSYEQQQPASYYDQSPANSAYQPQQVGIPQPHAMLWTGIGGGGSLSAKVMQRRTSLNFRHAVRQDARQSLMLLPTPLLAEGLAEKGHAPSGI